MDQSNLPTKSLRQLKWLWSKSSREEYATNRVTILHKQNWKVYMYSVSSICKDTRSSVIQSHQVCHSFYNSIIYKSQQHSTSLWYSPKFQSIIQYQPNIYSSLCLHQPTQSTDPLRTLPSPLKPPQFLLCSILMWHKLNPLKLPT